MRSRSALAIVTIAVAVVACTTVAAPSATSVPSVPASQDAAASLGASAAPVSIPSASDAPSDEPVASADGGGASATPGAIDPCSLLTADEASTAIGQKLAAGVSQVLDPDRACTFKSGLTELKLILAPPAPDAATAQAYWDAERSQVPSDISLKDLSEFDRSAYASGSVAGASLSALFVIHGTTFFDLYCGFPACSETASVAAAKLIVGRLP